MQGLALSARSRLALCRRRSRAGRAESPPGRRGAQPHIADRATLPHPPPVPAFKRRRGGLGYRIPNGGVGGEDCLESRPARLGGLRQEIARRAGRPSLPKDPQQPSQLSAGLTEASAPRPHPRPQVKNSASLRLAAIVHLVTRVLPTPRPAGGAGGRCLWTEPMLHETQAKPACRPPSSHLSPTSRPPSWACVRALYFLCDCKLWNPPPPERSVACRRETRWSR